MRNYKKEATNIAPLKQPLVCLNWNLKPLNGDEDLEKRIKERFNTFKKCEALEMEFLEDTVVYSFCQESTDSVFNDFFLTKLEKVEMSKAKKRKLLVDYHKRVSNKINDIIMAEIDYVVKGKIYCATSTSGEKYYLYDGYNIFQSPLFRIGLFV